MKAKVLIGDAEYEAEVDTEQATVKIDFSIPLQTVTAEIKLSPEAQEQAARAWLALIPPAGTA